SERPRERPASRATAGGELMTKSPPGGPGASAEAQAAMTARANGDPKTAATLFSSAGFSYEAAVCFYEAGDRATALATFLKVPATPPRYRRACLHVVRLAHEENSVTFELDHFMAPFVESGPQSSEELDCLYGLGMLYTAHEMADFAADILMA